MVLSSLPQQGPSISKRKKIFHRRGFQVRFAALTAGSLAVLLLFTALHGLLMTQRVVPSEIMARVWPELQASTVRLVLVGLLYVAVVTLAAVFLSHRALGPLGRLEEEIKKMAESNESQKDLKVREGDELENVVQAINELIHKAKDKH